jgi:hypothetical protein
MAFRRFKRGREPSSEAKPVLPEAAEYKEFASPSSEDDADLEKCEHFRERLASVAKVAKVAESTVTKPTVAPLSPRLKQLVEVYDVDGLLHSWLVHKSWTSLIIVGNLESSGFLDLASSFETGSAFLQSAHSDCSALARAAANAPMSNARSFSLSVGSSRSKPRTIPATTPFENVGRSSSANAIADAQVNKQYLRLTQAGGEVWDLWPLGVDTSGSFAPMTQRIRIMLSASFASERM